MENGTVAKVGVVITTDRQIEPLIIVKNSYGSYEMFYNNDPFGIISILGYDDLDIQEASDTQLDSLTELLQQGNRENYQGVFLLKDHLAYIKDTDDFQTVIVPKKSGASEAIEYDGYIDVSIVEGGDSINLSDEVMMLLTGFSI